VKYLFDTNICIFISRKTNPLLLEKLKSLNQGEAGMSVVTYCELLFGAHKSQRPAYNTRAVNHIAEVIPVLPFLPDVANHYGHIRKILEQKGTPIGPLDLLIAAHALSLKLTLVTNNTREFRRVEGLLVEDWC
jgi:tRNA(fMet)-specific endonuclease VapC